MTGGADRRAGDVAGATDQRHEQELDARTQIERRRVHKTLHMRVEPARQARQQSGDNENGKPDTKEIDGEAFHHGDAAAQAANRPALTRVEQISDQEHHDPSSPQMK